MGEATVLVDIGDAISDKLIEEAKSLIVDGRGATQRRINGLCDEIIAYLGAFEDGSG